MPSRFHSRDEAALPAVAALVGLLVLPLMGQQGAPAVTCDAPTTFADTLTPRRVLHVAAEATDEGDGSVSRPFATLEAAARAATPGTAIRLAPGRHRPNQSVDGLRGTASAPIWIGGEPGASPRPVIEGGEQGMGLQRAAYVVLHDLEVRGASQNGINLDDGSEVGRADASHHVALLRLYVHDVGDTGNQDCVKLSGVSDVFVYDSRFERCGGQSGSGIDQVGVHRSVIARNTFASLRGNAVQAKGGSTDIDIRQNRMRDAGVRAVNLGGSTGFTFFRPRLSPTAPNAEARRVRVFNNVIVGGSDLSTPFAFVGCVDCLVAHNLVSGAPRWLVRILQETVSRDGVVFEPTSRGRVVNNVFAFNAAALGTAVNVGANTAAETFLFANNHWLAADDPARSRPALPVIERGIIVGPPTGYAGLLTPDATQASLAPGSPEAGAAVLLPEIAGTLTGACRGDVHSIGPLDVTRPRTVEPRRSDSTH